MLNVFFGLALDAGLLFYVARRLKAASGGG